MPYIDEPRRDEFAEGLAGLLEAMREAYGGLNPGDVNYLVTHVVNQFLRCRAEEDGRPRYQHYNAAIGVLESAKLELYRRMVAPYEDEKVLANGDVY